MRTYTQIEVANILTNVMKDIIHKTYEFPVGEGKDYVSGYFCGMKEVTDNVIDVTFDYIREMTRTTVTVKEAIEGLDDFDEKGAII